MPDVVGQGRLHVCHVNSYCRGVVEDAKDEADESLTVLESMRGQLNSEVYHAVQNGTSGRCDDEGNVVADVPRSCLKLGGYPATIEGVRQAILDGYGSVVAQKGGRVYYAKGQEAVDVRARLVALGLE